MEFNKTQFNHYLLYQLLRCVLNLTINKHTEKNNHRASLDDIRKTKSWTKGPKFMLLTAANHRVFPTL